MGSLWQDVRHSSRALSREPAFAVVVILTLTLGIGATSAIFSVVNGVLLAPLPYDDAERVVMVWESDRLTGTTREASSVPDYYDFRQRNGTFAELAAFAPQAMNFTREDGEPERLQAAAVTHTLAPLLGVRLRLGRGIAPAEDRPGGERTALISEELWQRSFAGDPEILGRSLELDGESYGVIGVLPSGLDFPERGTELWVPLQMGPESSPRYRHNVLVGGRLREETSAERAQADMTRIAAELEREYPENRGRGVFVEPISEVVRGRIRPALMALFGAVLVVLLIVCSNLANLFLARGARRRQEVAVRAALGASSARLGRGFLVESLLLSSLAAMLGVGLALGGVRALLSLAPPALQDLEIRVDPTVLVFAVAVSGLIAIVFAALPAVQARRFDLNASLGEGSGRSGGGGTAGMQIRRVLIVAQTAFAVVLLVGAGLLLNSLWHLQRVDPGFDPAGVVRADFQLPVARYPRGFDRYPDWPEVNGFVEALLPSLAALPGVRSAALTTNHPLDSGFTNSFVIAGREAELAEQGEMSTRIVSADYFRTAGVPLVSGRLFARADGRDRPPVMLLNEAAVARFFPDGGAIGSRITFWGRQREVIGVVGNERIHGLAAETPPAMYAPLRQNPPASGLTVMLRATGEPRPLIGPLREAIWTLDRDLAVYDVATMEETLADSIARERFTSVLLALFAAVAMTVAALGVHGLLSYLVAQRRHEVGLRMVLGASRRSILGLILGQGLSLVLIGAALGLGGAFALSRLLSSLLFSISPRDLPTYALATGVLLAAAVLACALPARRATSIEPAAAMRSQ